MAKKDDRPVIHRAYFVHQGKVRPIEDFPLEDRRKAMARATLPMMRVMNPDWEVELKPECYDLDLEAYFKDAPTVGSLYKTKEAQEKIDAQYAAAYAKKKAYAG